MNKARAESIVRTLNKIFPAANPEYPIAFLREGETTPIVTTECAYKDEMNIDGEMVATESPVADYYPAFTSYPWKHPKLDEYMEQIDCFLEWQNAACLGVYER